MHAKLCNCTLPPNPTGYHSVHQSSMVVLRVRDDETGLRGVSLGKDLKLVYIQKDEQEPLDQERRKQKPVCGVPKEA